MPNLAMGKSSWLVWDKRAGIEDVSFDLSSFELCWSKKKHRRDIIRVRWFGAMGMEQEKGEYIGSSPPKRQHPNQKPTKLIRWFFEQRWSDKLNIVFDFFLGSGTTLIACEQTGRICYGCEISEKYCDVVVTRWENLTGNTAKLIKNIKIK